MDHQENSFNQPSTAPDSFNPSSIYGDGSYLAGNRTWHAEDSPWKAEQVTRLLQRNNLTPASVCEVGCGAGEILQQLSSSFDEARFVGYERSPQAMALCKGKQTARVSYRMQDIFEDTEVFDCLLCIDVFEHVEDYMGLITKLRSKAEYKVFHIPLDVSVLSVLHSSMLRARQRVGHLHYFTQETAIATLGLMPAPPGASDMAYFQGTVLTGARLTPSLTLWVTLLAALALVRGPVSLAWRDLSKGFPILVEHVIYHH